YPFSLFLSLHNVPYRIDSFLLFLSFVLVVHSMRSLIHLLHQNLIFLPHHLHNSPNFFFHHSPLLSLFFNNANACSTSISPFSNCSITFAFFFRSCCSIVNWWTSIVSMLFSLPGTVGSETSRAFSTSLIFLTFNKSSSLM